MSKKMVTSQKAMVAKLDTLVNEADYGDVDDLMHMLSMGDLDPGICMNEDCDFMVFYVEPDCVDGWCPNCVTKSVLSATELLLSV